MSVYGYVYLATIWYQTHLGMTALQSAVRMLPCMIAGTIAAVSLRYLLNETGMIWNVADIQGSVMWLGPRVKAPLLILIGCSLGR